MTSVPQLPVEPASTKALLDGEPLRTSANRPREDGREDGFAVVLAQATPAPQQPTKPNQDAEVKKVEVEGGATPAKEVAPAAASDAGEAPRSAAASKAETSTPIAEKEPVVIPKNPAIEATALAIQLDTAEALQEQPSAASAEEGVIDEALPESEATKVEDLIRIETAQSPEGPQEDAASESEQLKPTEKADEETPTAERPQAKTPQPAIVAPLSSAMQSSAPVPADQTPAPQAAPQPALEPTPQADSMQTEQAPGEAVPPAQKHEGSEATRIQVAAEPRRAVEASDSPKPDLPRVDVAPVVEFQVRKESRAADVRQGLHAADSAAALQSKQQKVTPSQTALDRPARPSPATESATKAASLNVADPREAAPLVTRESALISRRTTEPSDVRPPQPQAVASTVSSDAQKADAQTGRGGSDDTADHRGGNVDRKARPTDQAANVKSFVSNASVEPHEDSEKSQQAPPKVAQPATPFAQPTSTPQVAAPVNSVPLQVLSEQPMESARPTTPSRLPSEPEIAAQLQQQGGRTTLSVVLQDERLGRVALQLVERGGWIETAIRASDPRTAQTLSNSAAGLLEALQQRGLSAAPNSGGTAWDAQDSQRRDNPQRQQEAQRRRYRLQRGGGEFEGAMALADI